MRRALVAAATVLVGLGVGAWLWLASLFTEPSAAQVESIDTLSPKGKG